MIRSSSRTTFFTPVFCMLTLCVATACDSDAEDDSRHPENMGGMGGTDGAHHDGHEHGTIEFEGEHTPTIELHAHPDHSAYALQIDVEHFRFAPEHASTAHRDGEGHAHLYVDGQKLTRIYEPWFFLDGLTPGRHEIRVELSANDHSTFTNEGEPIDAHLELDVPEPHPAHDHGTFEVEDEPVPQVSLSVFDDAKGGWNLHVQVTDFSFAPENASGEAVDGEGHVHLFVGEEKIARLYGPWFYVGKLPLGEPTLRVELASNDHRRLLHDGKPIEASATVTVTEDDPHEH